MLYDYCTLGINHHLLFPGVLDDPNYHERTLYSLLDENLFDLIDLSFPDDPEIRKREIRMLREYQRPCVYNFPLFCMGSLSFDVNSPSLQIRLKTLDEAKKYLDYAASAGISRVTFASGAYRSDVPQNEQLDAFLEYSVLFDKEAKERGILALLEPFDMSIGKNLLLGRADACVSYIEQLRERGCENIALMQDMGHIPLIGEEFGYTIQRSFPYLHHIHLGNCVMKNPQSPYYGDKHPPLGITDGENDMPELITFIRALKDNGYLYKGGKNSISIEMQPYPGVRPLTSAKVGIEKIQTAFDKVFDQTEF